MTTCPDCGRPRRTRESIAARHGTLCDIDYYGKNTVAGERDCLAATVARLRAELGAEQAMTVLLRGQVEYADKALTAAHGAVAAERAACAHVAERERSRAVQQYDDEPDLRKLPRLQVKVATACAIRDAILARGQA